MSESDINANNSRLTCYEEESYKEARDLAQILDSAHIELVQSRRRCAEIESKVYMYERLLLCRRKTLQRDMEATRSTWTRHVVSSAYQCWMQVQNNSYDILRKKLQTAGNEQVDKLQLYTMVIRQLRHARKYVTKRMESWRKQSLRYESRIFIGDDYGLASGDIKQEQRHNIRDIEVEGHRGNTFVRVCETSMYLTKFKVKKARASIDSKVSQALQSEIVYISQMSIHLDTLPFSADLWESTLGEESAEGEPLAVLTGVIYDSKDGLPNHILHGGVSQAYVLYTGMRSGWLTFYFDLPVALPVSSDKRSPSDAGFVWMGVYISYLSDHSFADASSSAASQGGPFSQSATKYSSLGTPTSTFSCTEGRRKCAVCLHTLRSCVVGSIQSEMDKEGHEGRDETPTRRLSSFEGDGDATGLSSSQVTSICIGSTALRRLLGRHSDESVSQDANVVGGSKDDTKGTLLGAFAQGNDCDLPERHHGINDALPYDGNVPRSVRGPSFSPGYKSRSVSCLSYFGLPQRHYLH